MIKGQKELERKFAALEQVCDQQMERLVGQQCYGCCCQYDLWL